MPKVVKRKVSGKKSKHSKVVRRKTPKVAKRKVSSKKQKVVRKKSKSKKKKSSKKRKKNLKGGWKCSNSNCNSHVVILETKKCALCGTSAPFKLKVANASNWNCQIPNCGVSNGKDEVQCNYCYQPKQYHWRCNNCPMVNSDTKTICGACEVEKI